MIGGRRPLQGRKPADRRVRVERPARRRSSATSGPASWSPSRRPASPLTPTGRFFARVRGRRLRPPAVERGGDRRAPLEDARRWRSSAPTRSARPPTRPRRSCGSSSWPAPARCSCRSRSSIAIAILLAVVSVSYRQVCRAYPNGGGAYVVAKTNLAPIFGLIAAAALLIDYVMTVVGLDGRRDRPDPVGRPGRLRRPDRDRVRVDLADHDRQPARPARVREHLRGPDLPVRRARAGDRRDRRSSTSSAGTVVRPSRPSPTPCPFGTESRSASCSCSRPSPAARSR